MEQAIALVLSALLLLAAWIDFRERRLPNWLAGLILSVGIVGTIMTMGFAALGWTMLHAVIALVIGFALFALGVIGGGDAKTYAALAASFPLGKALSLLAFTSVAMFAIAVPWIIAARIRRRRMKSTGQEISETDFAKIPLGIAIAAGGLAMLWLPYASVLGQA